VWGRIKNLIAHSTIRQKLSVLIAVFVLYPVLVVSFFGYFVYARDIRNEIVKSLKQHIESVSNLTIERFGQTRNFAMMLPYDGTLNELFVRMKNGEESESSLYRKIINYLYSKFYSKQEIKAVSFYFTDNINRVYMVQSDNSYSRYVNVIHPIVTKVAEDLEEQFGYYISDDGEIYVIRKMFDRFSFKQYGTIVIAVDKDYMLDYFKDEFPGGAGLILIYNDMSILENGKIPDEDRAFIINQIRRESPEENGSNTLSTSSYDVIFGEIPLSNISLKYGVIMSTSLVMERYNNALKLLLLLTGAVALSMILVAVPLSRAIWAPVGELVGLMKQLEKGNLGVQSKRMQNDEFKFIFDSFNNMSNEIKHLFDVVYKEELARKEAQLAALQAHINPHFLYNTLEIMNWKARMAGNTELSEMIEALGTLFDAGMNKSGKSVVKIREELKLVDSYIFIMNKRFGKRLEFIKVIDETLLDAMIPKLLIQPILENAVVHGIEPVGQGCIKLIIRLEEGRIKVIVEDNGAGISDEDLQEFDRLFKGQPCKMRGSTGIGVKNVHDRIRILYGYEYGLSLEKREEGGTRAIITIPYIL